VFPKLNIELEIFFEVSLLLLSQRRHFLQFDNSRPVNFCFLLLATNKSSIIDIADQQIFANCPILLELQSDISSKEVFLGEDDHMLLILFDMERILYLLSAVDDLPSAHVDKLDVGICEVESAFES